MSRFAVWTVAALVLMSGVTLAAPFVNPPERDWPYGEPPYDNPWIYQFPYQRNIQYTFDNTVATLKPHYEGFDDNILFPSDYVQISGEISYFPQDPVGQSKVGIYGIDNRFGTGDLTGNITFHIDNWDRPNEWKHIWKEVIYDLSAMDPYVAKMEETLVLPPGYQVLVSGLVNDNAIGDGYRLENYAWKVIGNPEWEEIVITLTVPAGGYAFIDQVHIATECVPEPATITLALLGAAGWAALRRKRR